MMPADWVTLRVVDAQELRSLRRLGGAQGFDAGKRLALE
jgi:hypothetical protein